MNTPPDNLDLQSKQSSLNLAGRHLRKALEEEGIKRRIYREEEQKFRIENYIALETKMISVKAYDERKEMKLFQFKLDYDTTKEIRNNARIDFKLCEQGLMTLKKLISIQ